MTFKRLRNYSVIIFLSLTLLLGTFANAFAATQSVETAKDPKASDISGHWAEKVLAEWQEQGLIKGFNDGTLRPNQSISRSEFAALVNRAFQFKNKSEIAYKDVSASDWFYEDAAIAKAAGYMKGYTNGTFKPSQLLTRQEAAVIIVAILKLKDSDAAQTMSDAKQIPTWSKGAIGAVINAGLMTGSYGKFRPLDSATRAESVTVLDKALKSANSAKAIQYNKPGTYGPAEGIETIKGNVNVSAPGVTLRNLVIEGDLTLSEEIGEGDAYLKNVTVKGTTTVKGGGKNSIHFEDSVLVSVIVNKHDGSIRIVTEGTTSVEQITLRSGARLEESGLTGSGFGDVILADTLPADSQISLLGKFETVDVLASSIRVDLTSGSIEQLALSIGAANSQINLADGTSIQSLILNAIARVTGHGSIETAAINANGVTIEQQPRNVVVGTNIAATVGGQTARSTTPASGNTPSVTGSPTLDNVTVTYNQAQLRFSRAVSNLSLNDLQIDATVTETVYLENVQFDASTNQISFKPLSLDEHYGETLSVKVSAAQASSKFNGSKTGSLELEGFSGVIRDVNNNPVPDMTINFRRGTGNTSGLIAGSVITDENGHYTIYLPAGSYWGELAKPGFITTYLSGTSASHIYNKHEDATAIKIAATDEIRIVLTWNELPRDEDSHLLGPTPDNHSFHTYYGDPQTRYNNELYADLDHDDTTSYGPETTTIRKRVNGTYQFFVHNYSRGGSLRDSGAKVEIYSGSSSTPVKIYHITPGEGNELYWYVFDMVVNGDDLQFSDKDQYVNQEPTSQLPSESFSFNTTMPLQAEVDTQKDFNFQTSSYYNFPVRLKFSLEDASQSSNVELNANQGALAFGEDGIAWFGGAEGVSLDELLRTPFDVTFLQDAVYKFKIDLISAATNGVIASLNKAVTVNQVLPSSELLLQSQVNIENNTGAAADILSVHGLSVGDVVYMDVNGMTAYSIPVAVDADTASITHFDFGQAQTVQVSLQQPGHAVSAPLDVAVISEADFTVLKSEADKFRDSSIVTTAVYAEVYLRDSDLLSGTEIMITVTPQSGANVTDSVYLKTGAQDQKVFLQGYNLSSAAIVYSADIKVTRGQFEYTETITIEIQSVNTIIQRAQELIDQHDSMLDPQLVTYKDDVVDALANPSLTREEILQKITVLIGSINDSLS